jgi:hypothetical protein
MTSYADSHTVADKAAGWTDGQVDCRLWRHDWTRALTLASRGPGYIRVTQRCARDCGVKRTCTLNEQGYLVEGWQINYHDAKGYLMQDDDGKSLGRIDATGRAAIWREALMSMTITQEVADE